MTAIIIIQEQMKEKNIYKYCRKKGSLDAAEEVLLDVDSMGKDIPFISVAGFNVSPDNKLLAFGVDKVSRRQYTIQVKNLETGEILKDEIKWRKCGYCMGS